MKTFQLIAAISLSVLTLAFAGCSKEQIIRDGNDQPHTQTRTMSVAAGITGDENTRAAVTGEALPDNGTNFGLYGYKGTAAYTDAETEGDQLTLTNQPVTPAGAFVNGDVYWPTSNFTASAMKYYAYYPYQSDFSANITSMTQSSNGLTLIYTTPSTADVDLMYAASSSYTTIPTNGKVELTFNHILARLDVQVKLVDNTAAGMTGTNRVTRVALGSINRTGTYTGSTNTWSGVGTIFAPNTGAITKNLVKDSFVSVADFMFIPQNKTGRTATITCTLNGTARTISIANDKIPQFSAAGNCYILYVTLTVSDTAVEVSFDPIKVTKWGDGGSTTVEEPIEIP